MMTIYLSILIVTDMKHLLINYVGSIDEWILLEVMYWLG